MLSFTPLTMRQFRAVALAALGQEPGPDPPALGIDQGPAGQVLTLRLPGSRIVYRAPGHWPPARFLLPWAALDGTGGPLGFTTPLLPVPEGSIPGTGSAPGNAALGDTEWGDTERRDAEPWSGSLRPVAPRRWLVQPRGFLHSLGEAALIAAQAIGPFDPGRVLLRGRGEVLASDGVQALRQSGFRFPWAGDLVVPARGLRAASLLPGEWAVALTHAGSHLVFRTGGWELTLIARLGRFPAPDVLARPPGRPTRLRLSPIDAALLTRALRCGHAGGAEPAAVLLELIQPALVHVAGPAGAPGAGGRLRLYRSRTNGPVRAFRTQARCLRQALELGFRHFSFWAPGQAARAEAPRRTFAWLP